MRPIAIFVVATIAMAVAAVSGAESRPELISEQLSGDFVGAFHYRRDAAPNTGILMLGGAEGGLPGNMAEWLASEGYPVLALAYFKAEGLPGTLAMIPLEYFDAPVKWLRDNPKVLSGRIVVFGGSKGAELALLLASRDKRISAVVAMAPSSVVWQSIPDPSDYSTILTPRSSWSADGKGVPFVPYDYAKGFDPQDLLALYTQSLSQKDKVLEATIPVENINGPILLFSGKDDKMWPGTRMADAITGRLKDKHFPYAFQHIAYEDAGHVFSPDWTVLGGTKRGNAAAEADFSKRLKAFLESLAKQKGTDIPAVDKGKAGAPPAAKRGGKEPSKPSVATPTAQKNK